MTREYQNHKNVRLFLAFRNWLGLFLAFFNTVWLLIEIFIWQPWALLLVTHHQCRWIHRESSRVVHGASKRRWAPQTTRDTPGHFKIHFFNI